MGKDVAEILGYAKPLNALAAHVDEDDSLKQGLTDGMGRMQETIFINESGLYSLILSSKLPTAKKFKHWVTSEVLPSIRKHGVFAMDEVLADPDILINALQELKKERAEKSALQQTVDSQSRQIEKMKPKEVFADAVATSKTTILIGELAKILKGNGIEIGQNRLFAELRNRGYLIKRKGTDYNMPTQVSMEKGLFVIKETAITHADGHTTITKTPKVTTAGQIFFTNEFLRRKKACG